MAIRRQITSISEFVAGMLLTMLMVIAVPTTVCMPLWCDATYYDFVAWNLHQGKVLYTDIWEINFPGMALLQGLIRALLGFSVEALRAVDLMVVGLVGLVAYRVANAKQAPASPARPGHRSRWLFMLGIFTFYLSLTESCHCQRDIWMLLPVLIALAIRIEDPAECRSFGRTFVEGCIWGIAVWIKPHVMAVGLVVWIQSMLRANGARLRETLGLLAGGVSVGVLGLGAMIVTGAWGGFWEMMLEWNAEYLTGNTLRYRFGYYLVYVTRYLPWSLFLFTGIGGAIWTVCRSFCTAGTADEIPSETRSVLSAATLGWVAQAVLFQRPHDYVVCATILLCMIQTLAMFSTQTGRQVKWLVVGWTVVVVSLMNHPSLHSRRLEIWRQCLVEGSTAAIRDRMAMVTGVGKTDWQDLELVRGFLQSKSVQDGDVVCYSISTNPLYLTMNVNCPTRYGFVDTLLFYHPAQTRRISKEIYGCGHKYIVSDVWSSGMEPHPRATEEPNSSSDSLPAGFPDSQLKHYPWNQRLLFRAGRYTVHEVIK